MDPLVQVAIVSGVVAVIVAWLSRPTIATRLTARRTHQAVRRVEEQFENNGGSSARDALDRIEAGLNGVRLDVAHLRGRFDQHVTDTDLARHEGIRMWGAVEAVAKSTPPQGDQP